MSSSTTSSTNILSQAAKGQIPSQVDLKFVLRSLAENGYAIKDPSSPELLSAVQQLQSGSISSNEFATSSQTFITAIGDVLMPGFGALMNLARQVEARNEALNEAEALKSQYLSNLETARFLEPESVKVVVAVKEVVENALDSQDVVSIQADSLASYEFLREDIFPFLKEIERRGPADIPIENIRRRRMELKTRLEIKRKAVNVHMQRAESGIGNMANNMYYIKTNHLVRYMAAAALEILLRCYHVLLGRFDPDEIMADSDAAYLVEAAENRIETVRQLFKRYAESRIGLVICAGDSTESLYHKFIYQVRDDGANNDLLCPKSKYNEFVWLVSAGDGVVEYIADNGAYTYYYESLSGRNLTVAPGKLLYECLRQDITGLVAANGIVWKRWFQVHIDSIDNMLATIYGTGGRQTKAIKNHTTPKPPKTTPCSLLNQGM